MSLLVLSGSDVQLACSEFTPLELRDLMARVFYLLSSPPEHPTVITAPHRASIPMENHTALFMPARVAHPTMNGTTLKAVCVPRNSGDTRGLPASTIVINESTGIVQAVVNARGLTALRNAAGSLLSTQLVGIITPTAVVAFGAGKQVEAHLDLYFRNFPSIKSCTIVNRTLNSRVQDLSERLRVQYPAVAIAVKIQSHLGSKDLDANAEASLRGAVLAASIIICATSATAPLFPSSWVRTGTHVILIGSYTPAMREVDGDLIRRAINKQQDQRRQVLLVDSRKACSIEAGELIDARVESDEMIEIGERIEYDESGRLVLHTIGWRQKFIDTSGSQHELEANSNDDGNGPVTIFKSVGVGLQDVAIACAVVAKAEEMGLGTRVRNYDA